VKLPPRRIQVITLAKRPQPPHMSGANVILYRPLSSFIGLQFFDLALTEPQLPQSVGIIF